MRAIHPYPSPPPPTADSRSSSAPPFRYPSLVDVDYRSFGGCRAPPPSAPPPPEWWPRRGLWLLPVYLGAGVVPINTHKASRAAGRRQLWPGFYSASSDSYTVVYADRMLPNKKRKTESSFTGSIRINVYPAPHWDIFITRPTGGGGLFRAPPPPLISETTGPILKIQAAFESPGKTVEGKQIVLTSGSRVTSQVRSKSKCSTFRAWWHRRAKS